MPNSSQSFVNHLSSLNFTQFQFEWTLLYSNNKNTEYKKKFRLPKGAYFSRNLINDKIESFYNWYT